jgi:hypothetical protein
MSLLLLSSKLLTTSLRHKSCLCLLATLLLSCSQSFSAELRVIFGRKWLGVLGEK